MVTVGVGGARFGTRPLSAEALAAYSVPYASKSTAADAIHCMVSGLVHRICNLNNASTDWHLVLLNLNPNKQTNKQILKE